MAIYYNEGFINYKEILEKCIGWDIRLQCTLCGFRVRRHRNDYPGKLGKNPDATIEIECSNCTANADYPEGGIKTLHFIDIVSNEGDL